MPRQYEWSLRKAQQNRVKHGVTFDEALTVFADPLARVFFDETHAADEMCEMIVGHSSRARLLFVSFTERSESVRLISARIATKAERTRYEEENE